MPFRFTRLEIPEVVLIEPRPYPDARGFLMETYRRSLFEGAGLAQASFVQENYARSRRGVLRGLHYQRLPQAQGKLIGVVRGEIFDVAVDLRRGSPTYGRWVGATLTGEPQRLLYVPVGFAHGFCVTSDEADVVYKMTAEYAPDLEGGIIWNDPELRIPWPVLEPVLSPRDAQLGRLRDADHNFVYQR